MAIDILKLKFGAAASGGKLDIPKSAVTIFVGPNNSGKSLVLKEIELICRDGIIGAQNKIIEDFSFVPVPPEQIQHEIERITIAPPNGQTLSESQVSVGRRGDWSAPQRTSLSNSMQNPIGNNRQQFATFFLRHNTLKLDGRTRFSHVNGQGAGDLQGEPANTLAALFQKNSAREEVRRVVYDAFGLYFVIDPTALGQLRIRLSKRAPISEAEERGIDSVAVAFHGAASLIDEYSDGVRAFVGIMMEVVAGEPKVILIDEPEAFLHPSLGNLLGNEIAKTSANSEKRIFISTHSSHFVMGAIQSGVPINIVRFTYKGEVATARLLPHGELDGLMRQPLLRSTKAIEGLFYEAVIVTEGDSDRALYEEINYRQLNFKREWAVANGLFVNAQNKQTARQIIAPLRRLGIPAAAVFDIDILKGGGQEWVTLMKSAAVPEIDINTLGQQRAQLLAKFDEIKNQTGKEMKRDGGVQLLSAPDKESALNLLNRLAEYGLFVVANGELESWLKHLNPAGSKAGWLADVFEKMGQNPASADYLKPSEDDVWLFMSKIKIWVDNPNRRGMPG